MSGQDRFVLITNLASVWHGSVRLNAYALLLEQCEGHGARMGSQLIGGEDIIELRGFGLDSAWPVFSVRLKKFDHTLLEVEGIDQLLLEALPERYDLPRMNQDKPLDVWCKDFDRDTRDHHEMYREVWAELNQRAPLYWTGPNRPRMIWERNPLCRY